MNRRLWRHGGRVVFSLLISLAGTWPMAGIAGKPARIRVTTDDNYPPFVFRDSSGKLEGYEVDMWHLFEAHTGIDVELTPMSWLAAQQAVLGGQADVIDAIHRSMSREAHFSFSKPYATLPIAIYVDRRIRGVHDVASLRGFPVGVERNGVCADRLRSLGITGLHRVRDYQALIHAAVQGSTRIFCMDENPANFFLYRHDAADRFYVAFVLMKTHLHRAVAKGNESTLQAVEHGMSLVTPAEKARLRARWLDRPFIVKTYLRKAGLMLVGVLAILALMVLWVWALRRTVKARTRALESEKEKLRAMFDASPDAMWVKNQEGVHVDCNERMTELFDLNRDALIGRTNDQLHDAAVAATANATDDDAMRLGERSTYQLPVELHDGVTRQLEIIKVPMRSDDGDIHGVLGVARDITERIETARELRLAAAAFETQEALLVTDAQRVVQRVNKAFTRLTGFEPGEIIGKTLALLASESQDQGGLGQIWEGVERSGFWQGEQWIRVRHGQPRVVRMAVSAVRGLRGNVSHHVCTMIDLTGEREARANVDRLTYFDGLTELPNRHYLVDRLQYLIDAAGVEWAALLLVDLDHFKRVNDLRGHAAGDHLLLMIAERLGEMVDDQHVLARFGGGTFAVLIPGCAGAPEAQAEAASCAARVCTTLAAPFLLDDDEASLSITVSMGWTCVDSTNGSADAALKEAELAMYRAKAAGRNQALGFEPDMQAELIRQEALVHDLHQALYGDGLALHLQVQVNRSGEATGAEALLRWTRPCGESVSPAVFIPVAEDNGLVGPLGDWVLRQACAQLVAWQAQAATRHLSLAVNVSARQFADRDLVDKVIDILCETGASPELLKLEITETALLDNLTDAAAKLTRLRTYGVRISLDDFGTGYSSLMYLSRLPFDQIKIDRSFVARLPDDANDAMVAQAIVGMGQGMGMEVIAEGVETVAQQEFLMAQGCDGFQGYLIGRPVSAAEFTSSLETLVS